MPPGQLFISLIYLSCHPSKIQSRHYQQTSHYALTLTHKFCGRPKQKPRAYKMSDGDGLFLLIMPSGSKYWRLKYFFAGKEKLLALGVYPDVSLMNARDRRAEARKVLAAGSDPGEAKKEAKRLLTHKHANTFELVAREWHQNRSSKWTPLYAKKMLKSVETHIFSRLGPRPIADITTNELLSVMRTIEGRGADLAHRLLQICGQIFTYAVMTQRAATNPAGFLRGALKPVVQKRQQLAGRFMQP